ncbi:MAG: hypothetical protein CL663_02885 [Bacteroidetes bacterium]|mgnify:CR=1 FL=1|nr:hypothetical protein [Bacteroidota bacterium]
MLIRFFNQSYVIHFIAFLMLATALWIPSFVMPVTDYDMEKLSPIYNLIIANIKSPIILSVFAFVLLFVQSIYLNAIITDHELGQRNSSFASVFYFLIMSMHYGMLKFHPILLAGFFLIKAINSMLNLYMAEDQRRACFKIGFFIGISSLCYFPSIYFMVLVIILLLLYSIATWRKMIIPLIGLMIPYIFLATWYFVTDQLEYAIADYQLVSQIHGINFSKFSILELLIGIFGSLFLLSIILGLFFRIPEKSISVRKKASAFVYILIISILILFLRSEFTTQFMIIALPLTALTAVAIADKKKMFWTDLLFSISTILILINNFIYILNA